MFDGNDLSIESNSLDVYETEQSAIGKYEMSHKGRTTVTWGPLNKPIKIVTQEIEGDTKTFLDLGEADLIPVIGNADNDVIAAVKSIIEIKTDKFYLNTIHPSRLKLNHLADPNNIPAKDLFVVTGKLKEMPAGKK